MSFGSTCTTSSRSSGALKTRKGYGARAVSALGDQERGFERLSAKEQTIWREALLRMRRVRARGTWSLTIRCPQLPLRCTAGNSRSLKELKSIRDNRNLHTRSANLPQGVGWKKHRDANRNWQKVFRRSLIGTVPLILAFITESISCSGRRQGSGTRVGLFELAGGVFNHRQPAGPLEPESRPSGGLLVWKPIFHEGSAPVGRSGFSRFCVNKQ